MTPNIKNISIRGYLAERGIQPKYSYSTYGMYLSPLRTESTPSFKVDFNRNLWYDHGTGEGGSIIDLVMKLEQCSLAQAIAKLEQNISSFQNPTLAEPKSSPLQITSVKELQDPRLINYLTSKRSIDIAIARAHCKEVHYTAGGKPFFAVGFQSDAGGWELRNEYFKGGTSPKGVTTIDKGSPTCLLFEGFIDMLSYLTLKNVQSPSLDIVVLNSVVNLAKATDFLNRHQTIHTFLDNDEAGKRATLEIEKLGKTVVDQSTFYRNFKDMNDYLVSQKLKQTQEEIRNPIMKQRLKQKMR